MDPRVVIVNYDYIGERYGIPTDRCIEAVSLTARTEGIILCPVYTGKAMAGLINLVHQGFFKKEDNVIFLHTGGRTANFAFNRLFWSVLGYHLF